MFTENDHVIDHVDDYLHNALDSSDAAYVERHADACPICKVALDEARKRQQAFSTVPTSEASEQLIQATLKQIEVHEQKHRKLRRIVLPSVMIGLAASVLILLGANIYYATLKPSPYEIRVLGQTSLLAGTTGSLRIQMVNHFTGLALANVPVTLELRGGGQVFTLAEFQTDAQGTGQPRFHVPDWADGKYDLVVRAKPAREEEILTQSVHLKRSWKLMLSSDKPVYQPGQTIHVRSLALRQPDLKPVAGRETTFTIADPKGNIIFKQRDPSSAFGITSADCPLADEIIEGAYAIVCKIGDTESKLTVDVKKYVLPKFKIDVELDQPFYEPGQKVKGTVQADYFFGKPVADGVVDIEVKATGVKEETVNKITARTDPAGKATFELHVPDKLIGKEQNSGDARLAFLVTLQDSAGQKQSKNVSRIVTNQPLRIEVIPEAGQLVYPATNKVYLYVSYADGRPAKATVTLSGGTWENSPSIETSILGIAEFEIGPQLTTLDLTIRAVDGSGRVGRKTANLGYTYAESDFFVRTDKAVYNGGDTMRLTALGGGEEPVFLDFIKDGQTLLTDMIEVKKGKGEHTLDLPADLFGTIELCAYRFGPSGLPLRKTRVLYIRQASQLKIQAELDKKEYRPGKSAKVQFALTDDHGKPTPGAISLAAVDEAVFSVLDQAPGMERTFYLLEQQLLKPVYAIYPWAPDLKDAPPAEVDRFEQALFSRTVETKEPSRGQSVHTISLASFPAKERDTTQYREVAQQWVYYGWWALFGIVVVGCYISMWFVFRPAIVASYSAVAALGLCLVGLISVTTLGSNANLTFSKVGSAVGTTGGRMAEATPASPSWMNKLPEKVTNADKVGGGPIQPWNPASPSKPLVVREWFPETLLWRPEFITDDQGRASLDIDLADSITTWRLTGSAVSADGRLGAMQTPLRVFQPFFVDLNLPVALTRGDEVAVPVVVYNYLDKPQTVKLSLQEDKADAWFTRPDDVDAEQSLDLQPGEVRSTHYRLKVTRVGDHKLEVHALGSDVADAVRKPIEVVPDGRRVEQVVNGTLQQPADVTLTVPADAVEGSPKLFVKIYPSTFSQLVEGLDGIFRLPYGCFEQTSSTTYPNVLALDYLRRTKKSVPDVEAKARQYIHLGYQRLLGFEVPGGGFDWFGRPPANLTLTAYGLMEFEDMARVHDVDPDLIKRTRGWLMNKRNTDGSWTPETHKLHEDPTARHGDLAKLSTTAYVAWAVFGGQSSSDARVTQDFLLAHRPEQIDDPHVLALVCNALLAIDSKSQDVKPYLEQLEAQKKSSENGKLVWWEQPATARTTFYGSGRSGSIETTALAALALVQADSQVGTTRGALTWLVEQKDGAGTWNSTQATVLSLKALLAATDKPLGGDKERRIEVRMGDQLVKEIVIPGDQAEVMQQISLSAKLVAGTNRLSLTETTGTGVGYQVAFRYHVPESSKPVEREPLAIRIDYDRTELTVGDIVKATATVINQMDKVAPMVILDLPIPAGFALETDDLAKLVSEQKIEKFQVNARTAVVYLRGLEPSTPLKLTYTLRAKMPVQVAVPAARVYEYYDTDKQGRSAVSRMSVK